ncbi:Mariner Mos1 transposase [Caligus rogercresseyi]|uniref:Mariner Mos1 transposase n=1 Tax=Caligus rogercresseyi TaxID=217165 RepID=A0A7T8GU18_CALRO|nr:Mariner Mos1 transposase [Caligus rogercresseyi]
MSRIHKPGRLQEDQTMVDTAFEVNSISQSQIYRILALTREHEREEKVRTVDFIEAVRVYVVADLRDGRSTPFSTSSMTILGSQSSQQDGSPRCLQRITNEESEYAQAFLKLNFELGLGFFGQISKRGSSQWLTKGSNPPLKFNRQESRKKQMVLSFFDNCSVIFQHYLPMRTSVTAAVFMDVMNMFLKKFKEKRPEMAKRNWYFHFENAPCHTANSTKEFLAKKGIKVIDHPPYSPDLAPAVFFYFPVMKKMLEGVKSVQKEWTWSGGPSRKTCSVRPSGSGLRGGRNVTIFST